MHKKNWFHGQVVMEDELDTVFEYAEEAEQALARDSDCRQAETGDTPDMAQYGGIMEGGHLTRNGTNEYIDSYACIARDNLGRRIILPSSADIMLSHAGDTPEGDVTMALGDGAAIIDSCPDGDHIIATISLVYDEVLTDPRLDANGATVYFDVDESFHFNISIGVSWHGAISGAPSRAALSNTQVVLADLVLLRSGGNMQVITGGVCESDQDWDDLGGDYALGTGRRSDWFVADQGAEYPQSADADFCVRVGYARDAIATIFKQIQKETTAAADPCGTQLIGAKSLAGSETFTAYNAISLNAGNLSDQLAQLLVAVNNKAAKGADTLKPKAAGLIFSPEAVDGDPDEQCFSLQTDQGGALGDSIVIARRGMIYPGCMYHDDFILPWAAQIAYTETLGGGAIADVANSPGGRIGLTTTSGGGVASTSMQFIKTPWSLGQAPWMQGYARMATASGVDGQGRFVFRSTLNSSGVVVVMDIATLLITLEVNDTLGAGPWVSASSVPFVAATMYTLKVSIVSPTVAELQVDNNVPITATLLSGDFGTGGAAPGTFAVVATTTGGVAPAVVVLDEVMIMDQNVRSGL